MHAFLQLGYGGEVRLGLVKLLLLMELCHLYQTNEMMTAVGRAVLKALDTSNALQLYAFGAMYSQDIKEKAQEYIRHQPAEVCGKGAKSVVFCGVLRWGK